MSIITTRVTATTDPTNLHTCSTGATVGVNVKNTAAISVYLGSSGVASTDGFALGAGQSFSLTLFPSEALYGISTGATGADCHVFKNRDAT